MAASLLVLQFCNQCSIHFLAMAKLGSTQTTWFSFLVVVLLVLGIFFRFANLDRKVYWHDEALTSSRIAGYTKAEIVQQVFDGRVIGVEDLQKYQRLTPEKGLSDAFNAFTKNPEHPPLYYLMARFWMQLFGDWVKSPRSLSVLLSLLVFPCIYWLCLELFQSSLVAWVAIALVAISPFHILYAQEAREYSLWTVTILLSSASLLRALRLPNCLNWGIYAATLVLSIYSSVFSVLVAIAHGIYVATIERFRLSQRLRDYIVAASVGLLTFVPWLFIFFMNLYYVDDATSWVKRKMPLISLMRTWFGNLSRIFFDLNFDSNDSLIFIIIPTLITLLLVVYSFYYFVKYTNNSNIWLFIFLVIGVVAIGLIIPDLVLGGRRSSASRYFIPCYLGIQITVSYLFAKRIHEPQINPVFWLDFSSNRLWSLLLVIVISAGIISDVFIFQADTWWTKKKSDNHPQVSQIINQSLRPLVITSNYNFNIGEALSLSYLLDPKTKFQLVAEPNIPQVAEGFTDVFLYDPFPALREGVEKQNYQIEVVPPSKLRLERLIKRSS